MYKAGWHKTVIGIQPNGHAMHGYGHFEHRATGSRTPLYARALFLSDAEGRALFFCCLDLGYVTHAMREGVLETLRHALGNDLDESGLVLTCTHTHSGPGGCAHEALYNVVTPGFVPEHLEKVGSRLSRGAARGDRQSGDQVLACAVDPLCVFRDLDSFAVANRGDRTVAHDDGLMRHDPFFIHRNDVDIHEGDDRWWRRRVTNERSGEQ